MTADNCIKSLTHHQARPDCHHHFKPGWKLRDYFCNESGNGVPIVWFMEFCLIKAVNQYDVVFFRQFPLCKEERGGKKGG